MNALLATTFSTLVFHIHFVCLNELGTCWPWVDGIFYSTTKCLDRVNFSRLMFLIFIASISVGCLLASSGSIMDDGKRLRSSVYLLVVVFSDFIQISNHFLDYLSFFFLTVS